MTGCLSSSHPPSPNLRSTPCANQCFGWHRHLCCRVVSIYFVFHQLDLFFDQVHCAAVQTVVATNPRAGNNVPGEGSMPELLKLWLLLENKCPQYHSLCSLSVSPRSLESCCFVPVSFKYITSHITFARSAAIPNLQLWNWTEATFSKISFLNFECLQCFQTELLIDPDAFKIIYLKSNKEMVLG